MKTAGCIFCRIAAGEVPAGLVYEDQEIVGFRDINPVAPMHVLVVPRAHIASVNDLEPRHAGLIGRLVLVARDIARAEGVSETGYRLVVNTGPDSGQGVAHLHLHIIGGRRLATGIG